MGDVKLFPTWASVWLWDYYLWHFLKKEPRRKVNSKGWASRIRHTWARAQVLAARQLLQFCWRPAWFFRHGSPHRQSRSGGQCRHIHGPLGSGTWQTHVDPVTLRQLLALVRGQRRQPLVCVGQVVSTGGWSGLGTNAGARSTRFAKINF